jgi:hypothetical protein
MIGNVDLALTVFNGEPVSSRGGRLMKLNRGFTSYALAALAAAVLSSSALGAILPATNWALHNQLGADAPTIAAGTESTNSPLFDVDANKDNAAFMGRFTSVNLANNGDFVELNATLTLTGRTGSTGVAGLATQLRMGVFNGPDAAVALNDVPNQGFFLVYANNAQAANGHRALRAQASPTETLPLPGSNTINIASGTADAGDDNIQGANPGPVAFRLRITRNGGLLDFDGSISGTDSVTGNPYLSDYDLAGHDAGAVGFEFDRVGIFLGPNANAPSAQLTDVTITTNIPEPASWALAALALCGTRLSPVVNRRTKS